VYTLGYLGLDPNDLLRYMKATGALLVDIRYSPKSRDQRWHWGRIMHFVGHENYLHLREFGNQNYKTSGPIQLANPALGMEKLRLILRKRPVILLCACRDWRACHRRQAAEYIQKATGAEVEHLPTRYAAWVPLDFATQAQEVTV
jgi:uncharacterized protein (DUF488 family)